MLGAFNAPDEFVSVSQAARLEAAPPVEAAMGNEIGLGPLLTGAAVALPLGMRSLAAHMTGPALKSFLVDDLVPVLVDARGHERVLEQIRMMEGTAEALPQTTTLMVKMPRKKLADLARIEGVRYVEASYPLRPHCDQAHLASGLVVAMNRTVPQTGAGVLIGVVDTGIDVTHPAFRSNNATRLVNYFDQTLNADYDAVAIEGGKASASPDLVGHGTHVAGIAAGNGAESGHGVSYAGVAPEADLAVVKTTFATDKVAAAVAHIFELAAQRRQPCVINLSLGNHFGGHDGSTVAERTIDQLAGAGRLVVVSAGNEGGDALHASTVLTPGSSDAAPARWVANFSIYSRMVKGKQVGLLSIQVWHEREDLLSVALRSPNGESFKPPKGDKAAFDRTVFFVQASHQVAPYGGDNTTTFFIVTDPAPQWLSGWSLVVEEVRNGNIPGVVVGPVHAWIVDREMGTFNDNASRTHLIGMPGTAYSAITVASYATRRDWVSRDPSNRQVRLNSVNLQDISFFSSPGPTRIGVNKPEISAPGQMLVSALAATAPIDEIPLWNRLDGVEYAALQGTSMAAPYVTGALALLLQKEPKIDWAEARRRLILSTRRDAFTKLCWNPRWGYGKIDVKRLMEIEP